MHKYLIPVIAVAVALSVANRAQTKTFFGSRLPALSEVRRVWAQESEPAPAQQPAPAPEAEEQLEEPEPHRDFVDPQEIKNELRQTQDQLREVKRVLATAKRAKATEDVEKLAEIQQQILEFQKKIKALKPDTEGAREILEEYRDAQFWDTMNDIRRRVELPKELKEIDKRIKEANKLLANKQVQKAFTELGGDLEKMKAILETMKAAYAQSQAALSGGNTEEAEEAIFDIREGGHPGELTGILQGMRQFAQLLRSVRDTEIRDGIKEVVQPVIEALNEGDIREARMTIDELGPEIERTMRKAMQLTRKSKNREQFLENLQKLEERINSKLEEEATPKKDIKE